MSDILPLAFDSTEFLEKEVCNGSVQQHLSHKKMCWSAYCSRIDQLTLFILPVADKLNLSLTT